VLLIDMAAVSTRPATLVEQIVEQFPTWSSSLLAAATRHYWRG